MRTKKLMSGIILGIFLLYLSNSYVIAVTEKQQWERFYQKIYYEEKENLQKMGISKEEFFKKMEDIYSLLKTIHFPQIGKECVIISFGLGVVFPPGILHTYNWIYFWVYFTKFSFTIIIPIKDAWLDLENATKCQGRQIGVAIMKYGISSKGGICRPGFVVNVGYCLGGATCLSFSS